MYKLLPEANKDAIRREYSSRRVVVMLILTLLLLIFSSLAALPSLIHAQAKKNAALLLSESARGTSGASERAELESWAEDTKLTLQTLAPNLGDEPYEYFKSILGDKSAGVKITGLSWQKVSGALSVRVRGVASDRQTLLSFQNTLKTSPLWLEVELPVSTLAQDKDIDFELTLKPK